MLCTWEKEGSTHYYEVDFLITEKAKITALEVKASGTGKHESLDCFRKKYSGSVKETIVLSQKDVHREQELRFLPIYMAPILILWTGRNRKEDLRNPHKTVT